MKAVNGSKNPSEKSKIPQGSSRGRRIRWARRISQGFFLALFFFLLFQTEFRGNFDRASSEIIQLKYPVSLFLEMDPLVAVSTALSTHAIYNKVILALIIIAGTIFIGRFFCGWICPLGTLNQFFSSFKPERKGMMKIDSNRYKKWMSTKYYLLFAFLALSLFTSLQIGLLDPIAFLIRSLTTSILPGISAALRHAFDSLYASNIGALQFVADAGYYVLGANLLSYKPQYYHVGFLIGVIFLAILVLNRFITRFWCRGICPLGALMGLFSRWAIFGMEKDHAKCDDCNRCLLHCQGACDPQGKVPWRQAECHLCFNCESICPHDVIKFKFFPKQEPQSILVKPDLKRRRVMESVAAGVVALPLFRASLGLAKNRNSRLIRPPGSLEEEEFLARCIRCGQCMKVCPTNAIQPVLHESGIEGIWTPMLVMRAGYCEYNCVLCGEVCPTGAIWKITEAEKTGRSPETGEPDPDAKPIKIGTAFFDRGRCLPWAMDIPCIVCEEFCPTSPKAIWVLQEEVTRSDGTVVTVQRPRVDVDRCVGCGICENACPVQDRPAVYVTNIGETRSRTNQIRLESGAYK
ncbi:MAG: 4Fe-4S dicluster domain-containing protein [Acidobacteria bacterium]|nr:4Fe-4S dicluster domain-containing protein [Acidobacteriota bacterium]